MQSTWQTGVANAKFLIEWNRNTVQCKSYFSQRISINDLIDSSVQLISKQPDYAKHVADWCCKCKA